MSTHILTIRTDKPAAEVGLYQDDIQLQYETWLAHRQLAETIHQKVATLLKAHDMSLGDLGGIVVFQGPGSFTGLRIGLAVANALAYSYGIPICGGMGERWQLQAIGRLLGGHGDRVVLPEYGSLAFVTAPRK